MLYTLALDHAYPPYMNAKGSKCRTIINNAKYRGYIWYTQGDEKSVLEQFLEKVRCSFLHARIDVWIRKQFRREVGSLLDLLSLPRPL